MINFKKAKVEAVKEHRNVIIRFSSGSYSTCVDANDNDICDAGETTQTVPLPKDVQLAIPTKFTNDTTGYDDRGLVWNNQFGSIAITLADGSRTYIISMASSGGINIR